MTLWAAYSQSVYISLISKYVVCLQSMVLRGVEYVLVRVRAFSMGVDSENVFSSRFRGRCGLISGV